MSWMRMVVILGLLVGLAVIVTAVGKRAGGSSALPAPAPGSSTLPVAMAEHLTMIMEPPPQPVDAAPPSDAPPTEPLYTAFNARDPLLSLLPPEPPPGSFTADGSRQPPDAPIEPPPPLVLQGVFWGGAGPSAIINGEFYTVGDNVSGATITQIDRRGIEVEFQGVTYLTTVKGTTMLSPQELPWR